MAKNFQTYDILTPNAYFNAWVLLQQVCGAHSKVWSRQLRGFGMRPGQVAVLFVLINKNGSSTTSEISDWLGRERHTITGLINRMEANGLVERRKEGTDKRFTRIHVTDKGLDSYRRLWEANLPIKVISRLGEKDLTLLDKHLRSIRNEFLKLAHQMVEVRAISAKTGYEGNG